MTIGPCVPVAPVRGIVQFVPADFRALFPEFGDASKISDAQLNFNFARATILLNNSCCSRVQDANIREALLNQLTAHITFLTNGSAANNYMPAGIVGRVSAAGEGSVNVTSEYSTNVGQSMAYYIQTQYGALYWAMIVPYRTMQYVPPPADACIGPFPGAGFGPMGNGNCGFNGGSS